jgi:methylenetetrahydrofolate reductase (NADPH)
MALFEFRQTKRSTETLPAQIKEWVPAFVRDASIETLPQVAAKTPSYSELFPAGTSVYIAYVPRSDWRDIVQTAKRLKSEGLNPVPHVPARTIPNRDELERYLGRLAEDAGVTQVLAIGGDLPIPVGDFTCTMDVLETGLFDRFGIRRIGVAGHPEGNNAIGDDAILASLREKNAFESRTDADLHIVTQFCFDARTIIEWDKRLQRAGNRLPIHIGIAGPAKLKSLIHYAALCGVGASARMVTRQAANLTRLASVAAPDALVAELARYRATDPECGITNAHFFTFGGLARSARWLDAARQGDFTPTRTGFDVNRDLE